MPRRTFAAAAGLALLSATVVACSNSGTDSAPDQAQATPTTIATTPTALVPGQSIAFARTDTGARIGEIRFVTIEALPTDCIAGNRTGVTLAIRVEIENGVGEQLPVPDVYQLQYVDEIGASRAVETASIYGCEADYPEAVTAAPGGKTEGWFTVRAESAPTELVYSPLVGDQSSTIDNIKILTVTPAAVRVDVPDHLANSSAPTAAVPVPGPTSAPAPAATTVPTTAALAPPTALDSQGRPLGAGGALVECADENYQPGTGVFADGSMGYAPECLPGGSMR